MSELSRLFVLLTCNNCSLRVRRQTSNVSVWCSLIEHVLCCLCQHGAQPSRSPLCKHAKGEEEIRSRMMSSVQLPAFILKGSEDGALSCSYPRNEEEKKKNPTVNHDNIQLPACKVWLWDNLGLWRGRKVCVCLYRDCLLRKIWWLPSKYRRMVISFLFVLETGHQSEICKTRVNKWKACISRGGYNLSCKPRHL